MKKLPNILLSKRDFNIESLLFIRNCFFRQQISDDPDYFRYSLFRNLILVPSRKKLFRTMLHGYLPFLRVIHTHEQREIVQNAVKLFDDSLIVLI